MAELQNNDNNETDREQLEEQPLEGFWKGN